MNHTLLGTKRPFPTQFVQRLLNRPTRFQGDAVAAECEDLYKRLQSLNPLTDLTMNFVE